MGTYENILLAVDLGGGTKEVAERARQLAQLHGARISVLHVVEYIPVEPMGEAILPAVNLEDELVKTARLRLADLLSEMGMEVSDHEVVVGSVKSEIVRRAQDMHADLIVIGSHERHGLGVLLNFAEDTVLHASPCDVLAVRIRK